MSPFWPEKSDLVIRIHKVGIIIQHPPVKVLVSSDQRNIPLMKYTNNVTVCIYGQTVFLFQNNKVRCYFVQV